MSWCKWCRISHWSVVCWSATLLTTIACGDPKATSISDLSKLDVAAATVSADYGELLAPGVQFVNIVGGQIIGDSTLITDRGANLIYLLDGTGNVVQSFGGTGSGPGEFRDLRWSRLLGTMLFAYDREHGHVTRVDIDRRVVTHDLVNPPAVGLVAAMALGVLQDGSLVVGAQSPSAPPRISGVVQVPTEIFVRQYQSGNEAMLPIGSVRGSDVYFHVWPDGWRTQMLVALGRRSHISVGQNAVIAVDNGGRYILRFDVEGVAETLYVRGTPDRFAVTSQDRRILRSRYLTPGSDIPRVRTAFDAMPVPDSSPYFGWSDEAELMPVVATSGGDIWVLPYARKRTSGATWYVLDPKAQVFGTVRIDRNAVLLDATREEVLLGIETDQSEAAVIRRRIVWASPN